MFYSGSSAPPKQSKLLSVCGYFVVGDWGEVELLSSISSYQQDNNSNYTN